ncbi:ABC transporter permease [Sulfuriroseicoccus oceanibius]|uniref:ABC transporter permease n=1 Tax=Sulfuriroseicoccus oceanibius TaxID=2707525 RepID=A0A6B3L2T9_9BACT|nr:ABC transporter permease [Sulfuriroseicoccus oceanibius]QQL44520.1 ABC transporter permease [Sulfuriroseicoccus oceanibius]
MTDSTPSADLIAPSAPSADGVGHVLKFRGDWTLETPRPKVAQLIAEIERLAAGSSLTLDTLEVTRYDSSLTALILRLIRTSESRQLKIDHTSRTDPSIHNMMELALGVPINKDAERTHECEHDFFCTVGKATLDLYSYIIDTMSFIGETVLSLGRFVTGRARFRSRDFWITLQSCGAEALPIVTLISFLVGTILAFVGKAQLDTFGASIYVADLVAIAMVREMGCLMTGIIMSGRTGAAFAAQIGSMKVTQEIDALRTFGFRPFDYLVLPRMIAMILMMPLLTIYSNIVGITGGMLVSWASGIPPLLYFNSTVELLDITTASLGVIKSFFFGIVIAGAGCLRGMQSGNSSSAVGTAATRAVVTAITAIIVIDSFFAVVFTILDI